MFEHTIRSEKVTIDAPVEVAWRILTTFDEYGEWNPFTPSVKADLRLGGKVHMRVAMGRYRLPQTEIIETLEPPTRIAWGTTMGPSWMLNALREQRLDALGDGRCTYVTRDVFKGLLVPLTMLVAGRIVERGFNAVARALRDRAEAQAE